MIEKTLVLIKPEIGISGKTGKIISRYEEKGFKILALKMVQMDIPLASRFYEVHKEKEFYMPLVEYMITAPVTAMILEKENAVTEIRKLNGKTDPAKAEEGTIRHDYGETLRRNAVHSSDCPDSFKREAGIIFPELQGTLY